MDPSWRGLCSMEAAGRLVGRCGGAAGNGQALLWMTESHVAFFPTGNFYLVLSCNRTRSADDRQIDYLNLFSRWVRTFLCLLLMQPKLIRTEICGYIYFCFNLFYYSLKFIIKHVDVTVHWAREVAIGKVSRTFFLFLSFTSGHARK